MPSTVTRHSKQIPMPHNGPRGSPLTDRRNVVTPASKTAAASILPGATVTGTSLTLNVMSSGTSGSLRRHSRRQKGGGWNRRWTVHDLIDEQFCGDRKSVVEGKRVDVGGRRIT